MWTGRSKSRDKMAIFRVKLTFIAIRNILPFFLLFNIKSEKATTADISDQWQPSNYRKKRRKTLNNLDRAQHSKKGKKWTEKSRYKIDTFFSSGCPVPFRRHPPGVKRINKNRNRSLRAKEILYLNRLKRERITLSCVDNGVLQFFSNFTLLAVVFRIIIYLSTHFLQLRNGRILSRHRGSNFDVLI